MLRLGVTQVIPKINQRLTLLVLHCSSCAHMVTQEFQLVGNAGTNLSKTQVSDTQHRKVWKWDPNHLGGKADEEKFGSHKKRTPLLLRERR